MCRPTKILHLTAQLEHYGAATQLRMLAEAQRRSGYCVSIGALSSDCRMEHELAQIGVSCKNLLRRWKYDPFAALSLANLLRRETFDVVHFWDGDSVVYFSLVARWSQELRTLATLSERRIAPSKLAKIDRIVATSEQHGDAWRSAGILSHRVTVIAPGVKIKPAMDLTRGEMLRAIGFPDESHTIAVAGPLVRESRIDEAIWFFELVRTLDQHARLLVFGNGPDRSRLERYARLVSEPTAVRFFPEPAQRSAMLPCVEVFWSLREGGGACAVLEAMAAGVPVVAARSLEQESLVENGKSGYLAAPTDRAGFARWTLELLQNSQLASSTAATAKAEVDRRFSVDAMTGAYERLYSELLDEASSS